MMQSLRGAAVDAGYRVTISVLGFVNILILNKLQQLLDGRT